MVLKSLVQEVNINSTSPETHIIDLRIIMVDLKFQIKIHPHTSGEWGTGKFQTLGIAVIIGRFRINVRGVLHDRPKVPSNQREDRGFEEGTMKQLGRYVVVQANRSQFDEVGRKDEGLPVVVQVDIVSLGRKNLGVGDIALTVVDVFNTRTGNPGRSSRQSFLCQPI